MMDNSSSIATITGIKRKLDNSNAVDNDQSIIIESTITVTVTESVESKSISISESDSDSDSDSSAAADTDADAGAAATASADSDSDSDSDSFIVDPIDDDNNNNNNSDDDYSLPIPTIHSTVHSHLFNLNWITDLIQRGEAKKIIVLVGAGLSVSAGIPDFRSPGTGLYDNLSKFNLPFPEAVFSLDYFRSNPQPFNQLAKELFPTRYSPTPGHHFIKLLHSKGVLLRVFTQNIDSLESLAGIPNQYIVSAHGSFNSANCIECKLEHSMDLVKSEIFNDSIPRCIDNDCNGLVKPGITFFGENLSESFYNRLIDFNECDLLLVMGTSLTVYPFAGLIQRVAPTVPRVLINKELAGIRYFTNRTKHSHNHNNHSIESTSPTESKQSNQSPSVTVNTDLKISDTTATIANSANPDQLKQNPETDPDSDADAGADDAGSDSDSEYSEYELSAADHAAFELELGSAVNEADSTAITEKYMNKATRTVHSSRNNINDVFSDSDSDSNNSSSILSGESAGFDFFSTDNINRRDVFIQNSCDNAVREFAKLLNWDTELNELIENGYKGTGSIQSESESIGTAISVSVSPLSAVEPASVSEPVTILKPVSKRNLTPTVTTAVTVAESTTTTITPSIANI